VVASAFQEVFLMNKLRRDALKYLQLPLLCAPLGIAGAAVAAAKAKLAQPIKLALVESLSGRLQTRARPCSAICCGRPSE
jgi:branched-chain amino acid transport system substrate-binding protein